jgi:hypothetical protein
MQKVVGSSPIIRLVVEESPGNGAFLVSWAIGQSRRVAWDVAGLRPRLLQQTLVLPALRRRRRRQRHAARPGREGER